MHLYKNALIVIEVAKWISIGNNHFNFVYITSQSWDAHMIF